MPSQARRGRPKVNAISSPQASISSSSGGSCRSHEPTARSLVLLFMTFRFFQPSISIYYNRPRSKSILFSAVIFSCECLVDKHVRTVFQCSTHLPMDGVSTRLVVVLLLYGSRPPYFCGPLLKFPIVNGIGA